MQYRILVDKIFVAFVVVSVDIDAEKNLQPPLFLKRLLKIVGILNWIVFLGILLIVFLGSGSSEAFWKLVFFPLIGIAFAWTVFVARSFDLLARYLYKRHLRTYERTGQLVIIPQGLLAQTHKLCTKLDVPLFDTLFSYDYSKTQALCRIYQKNRRSSEVQTQLGELIDNASESIKQKKSPVHIRTYELHVKGISNLLFYLSSLLGL